VQKGVLEMANEIFANQIKIIRSNADMTMEQFAHSLNVTKSSVNMWENKGVVPREEVLRKIALDYGVSIDRLLGVENEVEIDNSRLSYLHRNLGKLDEKELRTATKMLGAVFTDIFNDDEEEEDDDI